MNKFVCDYCFPGSVEIGQIGEGAYLVLWAGKCHIMFGQGHSGDIIHTFENTPVKDPDPNCEIEYPCEKQRTCDSAFDRVMKEVRGIKMPMHEGYSFVSACPYDKYDPESGDFGYWLANKCGILVDKYYRYLNCFHSIDKRERRCTNCGLSDIEIKSRDYDREMLR